MPSFEKEFTEAKGAPIMYKDLELILFDRIPVPKNFSGTLKLISTNSEWKQAACLRVQSGKMKMADGEGKRFAIWDDCLHGELLPFEGTTKDLQLIVYNAWEQIAHTGVGFTNYWQHGAAMIVEVNGNTRRYRCNDGHPDENFDDIIFEITINE